MLRMPDAPVKSFQSTCPAPGAHSRFTPGTQVRVKGVLRNHILPSLGRMPVAAVVRSHVVALQQTLSAHPVTANKAVKVLSHMFRLGEGWGLAPEGFNPCRWVEKNRSGRASGFRPMPSLPASAGC